MFGGYAGTPWNQNATRFGTPKSFLFSLTHDRKVPYHGKGAESCCLWASPDVATADPATLERVAAWLLASPWELRKCRSVEAALLATAQVLGHGSHPKPAPVVASVSRELVTLPPSTSNPGIEL